MECGAVKCNESSSTPLYSCFGPCGRLFHSKCIGSNNAFLDKINASKFAVWYCPDCKKISLSFLALKMSSFKLDIEKLSKGFEDLSKVFNNSVSNLNSFSSPIVSVDKSTSTDDFSPPPPISIEVPLLTANKPISPLKIPQCPSTSPTASSKNSKRVRDNSIPIRNNSSPPPKRKNLRSNSIMCKDTDNIPGPSVPITPSNTVSVIPVETRPLIEHVPLDSRAPIEAVPKPKSVFISRLRPEIMPIDVLHHLVSKKIIPNYDAIKCMKISKPDSYISSFKIFGSPSLCDSILCSEAWPDGTLVKEFSFLNKKRTRLLSEPSSKN